MVEPVSQVGWAAVCVSQCGGRVVSWKGQEYVALPYHYCFCGLHSLVASDGKHFCFQCSGRFLEVARAVSAGGPIKRKLRDLVEAVCLMDYLKQKSL